MTRYILLTHSLPSLEKEEHSTASHKFEAGLADALSSLGGVSVLALSKRPTENLESGPVQFIRETVRWRYWRALISLVRRARCSDTWLIGWGYDPRWLLPAWIVARLFGSRIAIYVFDHHSSGVRRHGGARRVLLNCYFTLGMRLLRYVDAVLTVNPGAADRMRLPAGIEVSTAIGIPPQECWEATWSPPAPPPLRLLAAGSLEPHNGTEELIHAVQRFAPDSVTLSIYGEGTLRSLVERAADGELIAYFGAKPSREVASAARLHHVACVLRDTSGAVGDVGFPSKLLEYFSLGIPVLSSCVLPSPTLKTLAQPVQDLQLETLVSSISTLLDDFDAAVKRTPAAKSYCRSFEWPRVAAALHQDLTARRHAKLSGWDRSQA